MVKIKVSQVAKDEFASWVRSVGVATLTYTLAIIADADPAVAILLGSLAAPLFKLIDPKYKNFGVGSK